MLIAAGGGPPGGLMRVSIASRTRTSGIAWVGALAGVVSACSVVDRAGLDSLLPAQGGDSGVNPAPLPLPVPVERDAGPPKMPQDACGDDPGILVLNQTMMAIAIDTREANNAVSSCGGAPARGHDAFVAVDVAADERWHFRLRVDPGRPTSAPPRNPFLYLLPAPDGACDSQACRFRADLCPDGADEQLTLVVDTPGRWYVGVDDRLEGGGTYLLDAVRPTCGNGMKEPGESCDRPDPMSCDGQCRQVVSRERPTEHEVNDDAVRANAVRFPSSGELAISGTIGGQTCAYSDYFAIDVPAAGGKVHIDPLGCGGSGDTPFDLVLLDDSGETRVPAATNVFNCAWMRSGPLPAGSYLLLLRQSAPVSGPVSYNLMLKLLP